MSNKKTDLENIASMEVGEMLLTERQVAEILNLSMSWLQKARIGLIENGPPFMRLGRNVRYTRSSLDAWICDQQDTGANND